MTQPAAPRSRRLLRLSLAAALGLASHTAHAATITQELAVSENVTLAGFSNGATQQFFSIVPTFNLFDTSLGTLNSATLSWNVTGHVTLAGNFGATAYLSYSGKSVSKAADTDNDPPNDVDFSFIDSLALATASVEGLGPTNFGPFVGSIGNHSGYFTWGGTLTANGKISLVYDYTVNPSTVPEPGVLALLGLVAAAAPLRRRFLN